MTVAILSEMVPLDVPPCLSAESLGSLKLRTRRLRSDISVRTTVLRRQSHWLACLYIIPPPPRYRALNRYVGRSNGLCFGGPELFEFALSIRLDLF